MEVMDRHAGKIVRTINSQSGFEFVNDEKGQRIYQIRDNKKTEILNTRFNSKGSIV